MSAFQLLCGTYQIGKMLGEGSYGKVYQGESLNLSIKNLAIKIASTDKSSQYLQNQYKVYLILMSLQMSNIPKIYDYRSSGAQNILVMEKLGKNLEQILSDFHYNIPLQKGLDIGSQMLTAIQQLHKCQFIHRDIKPENFLFGKELNSRKIYLIDFGLTKRYRNKAKHIPYKQGKQLVGTIKFASTNNHFGIEQSRRDDIESLAYVLVYMLKGKLPWQQIKGIDAKNKQLKIMEKKMSVSCQELTKGLPQEIRSFVSYARSLNFDENPDYIYLSSLLRKAKKNKLQIQNKVIRQPSSIVQQRSNLKTIDISSFRKSFYSYDRQNKNQSTDLRKRVAKNESTNKIIKQIRSNKKLVSSQPFSKQKKSLLFHSSKMVTIQPISSTKRDIFKSIATQKTIMPRSLLARS